MTEPQPEPMIWTWAGWEPLQFYRRLGGFHEQQEGNALWQEAWAQRLRSEETAVALAEAGINWVTTHCFKGFGLDSEAEEITDTAALIEVFHRHGIHVFTYVQYSTIVLETFRDEVPDVERWQRLNWRDGRNVCTYGSQDWRSLPCANQPGVREYLLRCVDKAIDIGADGIWVDNLNADGCRCTACQEAFRAYLRRTIRDPWQELGLQNLHHVGIPLAERQRDPLFMAWTRCRCEEVKTSIELIATHARRRKPDVLIAANIGLGSGQRAVIDNADWLPNLATLDVTYAENGRFPRWADGEIIGQHYPMKFSAAVGVKVVPGAGLPMRAQGPYRVPAVPAGRALRRVFAESVLFGAHAANGPWGLRGENANEPPAYLREPRLRRETRDLAEFYRTRHALFAATRDAAPVGLLHSLDAMIADEAAARQVSERMAQALLQHQIPFRYIPSDRPECLAAVSLLVLAHVLPMSDHLVERVRAFAEAGGRLLATGRSSLYDEWMRQRRDYGLAHVFGAHFSNGFEAETMHGIHHNPRTGCALLPGEWGLQTAEGAPACGVTSEAVAGLVRSLLPRSALPRVLSPLPHVVFDMRATAEGDALFGFINYADSDVHGVVLQIAGDPPGDMRAFSTTAEDVAVTARQTVSGTDVLLPPLDVDLFVQVPGVFAGSCA